jgi:GNAT superfamily N-acetyltransferase
MAWRLERNVYDSQKHEGNRRALRALVERGDPVGLLACAGEQPVAWVSVAPREQFVYLRRTRTLQRPDDKPVWSVTCFFIRKDYRQQGLSAKLLGAAAAWVRSQGGTMLEGYPIVARSPQVPAVFAWTGLPSAFGQAGFRECGAASRSRVLMRRALD